MRTVLITPDSAERSAFESAAKDCPNRITLSRTLDDYPDLDTLSRMIRAWGPEALIISLREPEKAEIISRHVLREFEGLQLIGIHNSQEPEMLRRALHMRMRELISLPIDPEHLMNLAEWISAELKERPVKIATTDRFYAFLPAKSGVGASTLAANTSWAFSRMAETRVLLADFDLASGIAGFLFDAEHGHTVTDAINRSHELDDDSWQRLTKRVGEMDLLLSGAPQMAGIEHPKKVTRLIEFARRTYSVIAADLPDSLDPLSLNVLREANRIFLTTTPELASLRLAKLKAMLLQKMELDDRTVLLVNRWSKKSPLSLEEIEKTVGVPVLWTFESAYEELAAAMHQAKPSAKLAPAFDAFTAKLLDRQPPKVRRRFVERFALVPARYGFEGRG